MLEVLRRRPGPGGASLRLEALEDRAVPAVIGGVVYHDQNLNGLLGSGEPGIAGTQLRLRDSAGQVVATTTSDAQGRYQFSKRGPSALAPGTLAQEAEFASTHTDVSQTASVNQFDPTLGQLTAVELIAEGAVQSQVQLENLEQGQATLKTDLAADIQFQAPGAGTIEAKPATRLEATLGGFDGQTDLTGTSGADLGVARLEGQFTSVTISNPADLAAYVGTGKVSLTQNASVTATTSGPGNLLAMIRTTAAGKVKVVYHYTPGNDLAPGKYTIVQTQPGGYLDGADTKDNRTPIPGSQQTDTIEVTVSNPTDRLTTNHFGEVKPRATPAAPITAPKPVADTANYASKFFFSTKTLLELGW